MKKNSKGFTLVELLAVIVVLAVIMVIATTQVNKTIKSSRANAFVESYQMIVKEMKNRMVMDGIGTSEPVACANASACATSYDISSADYALTITQHMVSGVHDGSYDISFSGNVTGGKFEKVTPNDVTAPTGATKATDGTSTKLTANIK